MERVGGGWKRVEEGERGWRRKGEGEGGWERVEDGGTRCPKAICGHRFPCPVVSVLIFSLQIFDVNRAAAPKGAMSLLSGLVTPEDWLYLSSA